MRRNFDLSTVLAALGAVNVVVALFFEWYDPGLSAWDVFEIVDWALLALALFALAVLAAETFGTAPPSQRMPWIAGAMALLVVAELIDAPPAAAGSERAFGAWLALGGIVLLVAGVGLALLRISVTIDVAGRERRRRTAAVDARASDGPATTDATGGGLWKRAPAGKAKGQVEGEPGPSGAAARPAAPAADAPADADLDRTQPLPPTGRPDDGT